MYLARFLLLKAFIVSVAANNIFVYENAFKCEGLDKGCINVPNGTCCRSANTTRLYGSVKGHGDRPTDQIVPLTKSKYTEEPRSEAFVGGAPAVDGLHECLIVREMWVIGAVWQYGGGFGADMGPCENAVMGDDMFTEGGKTWVISSGKMAGMATEGLAVPTAGEDMLEFFKTHADTVLSDDAVQNSDLTHVQPQMLEPHTTTRLEATEVVEKRDSISSVLRRGSNYLQELFKRGQQCACRPWYGPKGDGGCICSKDDRRSKRFLPQV